MNICGLEVCPGDLVHADRHGAVVIPAPVVPQLEQGINKLLTTENIVLDAARKNGFDFDSFVEAWTEFERSRT